MRSKSVGCQRARPPRARAPRRPRGVPAREHPACDAAPDRLRDDVVGRGARATVRGTARGLVERPWASRPGRAAPPWSASSARSPICRGASSVGPQRRLGAPGLAGEQPHRRLEVGDAGCSPPSSPRIALASASSRRASAKSPRIACRWASGFSVEARAIGLAHASRNASQRRIASSTGAGPSAAAEARQPTISNSSRSHAGAPGVLGGAPRPRRQRPRGRGPTRSGRAGARRGTARASSPASDARARPRRRAPCRPGRRPDRPASRTSSRSTAARARGRAGSPRAAATPPSTRAASAMRPASNSAAPSAGSSSPGRRTQASSARRARAAARRRAGRRAAARRRAARRAAPPPRRPAPAPGRGAPSSAR